MTNGHYHRTELPNGLRIVTEHLPQLTSVSVGIWVEVGSRNESREENGSSHFIEHLSFKGTKNRTAREIAQSLESLGGTLNAFTSREHTCYYARVLPEDIGTALDVLADILTDSLFDPEEVERERGVILEEIKDVFDTPSDIVNDYFASAMWDSHPLGQAVMGTSETVKGLRRSGLLDYVKRHYTADQVVIAAAGNVDHQRLVNVAAERFRFPKRTSGNGLIRPRYGPGRRLAVPRDSAQTYICLGTPSVSFQNPQKFVLLILNAVLGGGMASRLFQSVREQHGLAYTIYSYQDFYYDTGVFGINLGTDANHAVAAVDLILEELQLMRKTPLSDDELSATKSQLKGGMLLSLEGSYNRMTRLARHELFLREFVPLEKTVSEIERITAEDVRLAADELFTAEQHSLVALGPIDQRLTEKIDWSILG